MKKDILRKLNQATWLTWLLVSFSAFAQASDVNFVLDTATCSVGQAHIEQKLQAFEQIHGLASGTLSAVVTADRISTSPGCTPPHPCPPRVYRPICRVTFSSSNPQFQFSVEHSVNCLGQVGVCQSLKVAADADDSVMTSKMAYTYGFLGIGSSQFVESVVVVGE